MGIGAQRKGTAIEARQRNHHRHDVAELAQAFEAAIGERRHIRREPERHQIDRVDLARLVNQAQQIAVAPFSVHQRRGGIFRGVAGEILQERVAGAQRQKTQRRGAVRSARWKNAVDDFVAGAVPADGHKIPVTSGVRLRRELHPVARTGRCYRNFQRESRAAQPIDRRRRKFAAPAAAGRRIHHREELRFQICLSFSASMRRRFYGSSRRFYASAVRRFYGSTPLLFSGCPTLPRFWEGWA
jgi:hypothetical protein